MQQISQQSKDLLNTFINQIWRLVSGPIILVLIPIFLSAEQQGYWFLFISLGALSIFADLGFSNIILQFSAHEYAFLYFNDKGFLQGEEIVLKRLGSFLRFTIKWISVICIIVFPLMYIIGIIFFTRDNVLGIYFLPWTLYAIGTLVVFFNNSLLSFIEGLDKIAVVQRIRFRVAVLNTGVLAVILVFGGNIYALAIGILVSGSSIFISILGIFKALLKQLLDLSKDFVHSWKKEVVPLFIRYAISWSSGYFIFQIYTPLMHYFHGPIYSGKVGISLALVTAVFSMSNIWMYTIIPKMNMLISQKLWFELDKLFKKRLCLSLGTYLFIGMGIFAFVILFGDLWVIPRITSRFLPGIFLVILLISYFTQLIINSLALYLRGHKKEPYVIPSLISAIWITITTVFAGLHLPPTWFFSGFISSYIWGLPVCYIIYRKSKVLWHG